MNFHNASFKAAYGTSEQLPASTGPEVSFAGRSNVGKSALLTKRMSGKGLNAFKAGSTACELCETAMAKPVRRNVASGDDKGRPFFDESIQPVP